MGSSSLLVLPTDILILLPEYLHNIEDYTNLASSCRTLRECMDTATPNVILRLAAAQSKIFFRPSPHFLIIATARELGDWARRSDANEKVFQSSMQEGIDSLLNLALERCGLTMERIRELYSMRFSIINPITDLIDKCVGQQWYSAPDFWDGGVDDAYTIDADPSETLFHLSIYGELFGPDFETILRRDSDARRLSVDTRLEFIKYCLPDFACWHAGYRDVPLLADGSRDPRRATKATGPYVLGEDGMPVFTHNNNLALTWVLRSSRWKPHWKETRAKAGPDFQEDFEVGWPSDEGSEHDWRQKMWEAVMVCQGLEGLGMIKPGLQDRFAEKIKEWRNQISQLGGEPKETRVGRHATLEYPFLLGDLRICASGYVVGT